MFCESSPVDDSMSGEDAVAHLTSLIRRILLLAVHVYGDEIQHLLEPPPEHARIRFHRLNIKNGSRLDSPIKMSDLVPPVVPFLSSFPGCLQATITSSSPGRSTTEHQERLPTRGPSRCRIS